MPQFLVNKSAINGDLATITGGDAKHITNVLRLKQGDWLMITDGYGKRWSSEIITVSQKEVKVKLISSPREQNTDTQVVLAQAIIKHDHFEWIIQKSVELGCSKIIPFSSDRTIPKLSDVAKKTTRWQKIADEAAKQCGTSIRPKVEPIVTFQNLIGRLDNFENKILFYEGESKIPFERTSVRSGGSTIIIIGPEGGFSANEIELAKKNSLATCGLGPLILRVETAAIAGLTLIQNKLGYFDQLPLNK